MAKGLAKIPELQFTPPDGAFYAFIGVGNLVGRKTPAGTVLTDDTVIAAYLLNEFGLSSIPGIAFASPNFIRLSIAASDAELESACERLAKMVASLSKQG